jgi:membrane glycosyltransferase
MLQNVPMATVLLFAPMITKGLSRRARRGSMAWRLFATPEDLATPDIVRAAERMGSRGTQHVRRFAAPRRSRSMQRFGLVVRRAMRRVRRAADPTRRAAD